MELYVDELYSKAGQLHLFKLGFPFLKGHAARCLDFTNLHAGNRVGCLLSLICVK